MFTVFREAGTDTAEGPVSMRRVLAFFLTLSAVGLFVGGFFFSGNGWTVFLPGISALAGALILLICTTAADIADIVSVFKK
jgi:hypothetical protein